MSQSSQKQGGTGPVRTSARTASGSSQPSWDAPASIPPSEGPATQETQVQQAPASSQRETTAGSGRPAAGGQAGAAAAEDTGPRRIRLVVSRVDPWSVMKLSFLLSIALGIATVVATAVVWGVLNSMGVFAKIQGLIQDIGAMEQFGQLLEYVEFSRVISVATVIGIVDVILFTALCTLGAFLYNLVAAMVGGLHTTLTDE